MPSRYNLPHIDITAFALTQEYVGEQGHGSSGVRERAAHGQRIQNELRVALEAVSYTHLLQNVADAPLGQRKSPSASGPAAL